MANAFFQQYFLSIMQDIFYVLTDTDHKSGFKLQSLLLARMFQLVETNQISVPLFDPSTVPDPSINNATFLRTPVRPTLRPRCPLLTLVGRVPRVVCVATGRGKGADAGAAHERGWLVVAELVDPEHQLHKGRGADRRAELHDDESGREWRGVVDECVGHARGASAICSLHISSAMSH